MLLSVIGGAALYYFRPNDFRRLTAPLLDSIRSTLSDSKPGAKTDGKKPKTDFRGKYQCTPKGSGDIPINFRQTSNPISIFSDSSGQLVMHNAMFNTPIRQNGSNTFTYRAHGRTTPGASFKGRADAKGNLTLTTIFPSGGKSEFYCARTDAPSAPKATPNPPFASKAPPAPKFIKAVFMRPCEGDFYSSFVAGGTKTKKQPKTNYGDGTVAYACKDLKGSGVTDVFLPFKVDDQTYSHCGKHGELLYNSQKYHDRINPKFQAAFDSGIDPIKAIMNSPACQGLKFHAWFPVFKDPFAIIEADSEMAGQKAEKRDWFGLRLVSTFYSHEFAEPANPKVIQYELALLQEIVDNYPLQGINLDYIRYTDTSPPEGFSWIVNSDAVDDFVKRTKDRFPLLIVSADVFPRENFRRAIGQNNIFPYLDMALPMVYSGLSVTGVTESHELVDSLGSLHSAYPHLRILPIIRGWRWVGRGEDVPAFISNLKLELGAIHQNGGDIAGVFTYESLLNDSTLSTSTTYGLKNLVSKLKQ